METKLNLYQKLLQIQKEVLGLKKDKKSNTYEYVTGTKVIEHIKPLMNSLGLILKQEVLTIENVRQDYKTGIGTSYEKPKSEILSKVMMRFTWIDCETGDRDENLWGANGQNDWEKGLGSALTYGERYFLLKFFHIATDEDDIDNPDRKPENKSVPVTPTVKPPLPTLIYGSEEWKTALKCLNGEIEVNGMFKTFTIEEIRKKYVVSAENADLLNQEKDLIQKNK